MIALVELIYVIKLDRADYQMDYFATKLTTNVIGIHFVMLSTAQLQIFRTAFVEALQFALRGLCRLKLKATVFVGHKLNLEPRWKSFDHCNLETGIPSLPDAQSNQAGTGLPTGMLEAVSVRRLDTLLFPLFLHNFIVNLL
jgi:hypothetical protein